MHVHPTRAFWIMAGVWIAAMALCGANLHFGWASEAAGSLVLFIPCGAASLWYAWYRGRFFAYVRSLHHHVCTRCVYPLDQVQAEKCPECGTSFDQVSLARYWIDLEDKTKWGGD
jgi:hypothetical protein